MAAVARADLIVVGAGIVGLAHAWAAARRGLRVTVVERDSAATRASVRNFGFITVSGQADGDTRRRALRSRELWAEAASGAGIEIVQRGAVVLAQREEALDVLQEFASGAMGTGCELWDGGEARRRVPRLRGSIRGALWSPHELRVEARDALPRLARWLAQEHGVTFLWNTAVVAIEETSLRHAQGRIEGDAIVAAPGVAVAGLAPALAARVRLRDCKLQMLRVRTPGTPPRFPAVAMSDLSLVRYPGFAAQPAAERLHRRLEAERAGALADGVHLIVAQSADGTLVVGDSHHYGESDEVARDTVEARILAELDTVFDLAGREVAERWVGHYPVADVQPLLVEELAPRARLVAVTSGTGMSTAFAIGEETVAALFG